MRRQIISTLTLFILVAFGLAVSTSAQSTGTIKVNIPFEFAFGGHLFPAGEYVLVQPEQHTLQLRDANGRTTAQAFTQGIESSAAAPATTLKFNVSEGQHDLVEVWREQDSSGQRLYPVKTQKTAKHLSTGASEPGQP